MSARFYKPYLFIEPLFFIEPFSFIDGDRFIDGNRSESFSYPIMARISLRAFFSRRETCACEMPTSAEISVCVFPS